MLNASFSTSNAFLVADVKRIANENSAEVRVAIREYGQMTFVIPDEMLPADNTLVNGELGYPLSDYIGVLTVSGTFSRVRKSPTAAPSLLFTVTTLA